MMYIKLIFVNGLNLVFPSLVKNNLDTQLRFFHLSQRIFYLQDYCKEVRMNDIEPLLIERYNDAADDVIAKQKKYMKK